jgi:hypothetical protein
MSDTPQSPTPSAEPVKVAVLMGEDCPCGSKLTTGERVKFVDCHGRLTRPTQEDVDRARQPQLPVLGGIPAHRRLNLGCGQDRLAGFEGIDLVAGPEVDLKFDLLEYPWPVEDDSVVEIYCSHFIEHIPMEYVDRRGNPVRMSAPGARDALLAFFDECHRVLCHDGRMTCIAPSACGDRTVRDPTHRRLITPETYQYLSRKFREAQKLDHYNVTCDFDGGWSPALMPEMDLRHDQVIRHKVAHERNWVLDWHAYMRAVKRS